jgi:hypothetical protein
MILPSNSSGGSIGPRELRLVSGIVYFTNLLDQILERQQRRWATPLGRRLHHIKETYFFPKFVLSVLYRPIKNLSNSVGSPVGCSRPALKRKIPTACPKLEGSLRLPSSHASKGKKNMAHKTEYVADDVLPVPARLQVHRRDAGKLCLVPRASSRQAMRPWPSVMPGSCRRQTKRAPPLRAKRP